MKQSKDTSNRVHALELNKEATLNNIKDLFFSSEHTEEELAEHMGCSVGTINNWLNCRSMPDVEDLTYLCLILGSRVEEVLVYNYQKENSTLMEQRDVLRKLINEQMIKDEEKKEEKDTFEMVAFMSIFEDLEKPILNLNEFVMWLPLMDDACLAHLRSRTALSGLNKNDQKYISSVLKYIAENMIPDSDEKAYLLEITNFCTHEPFIMTATDKSLDYKYKRLLKLLRYENASEEVRENLAKKALNVAREAMMSLTY